MIDVAGPLPHASESNARAAVERGLRVLVAECIGRLVEAAAENVPLTGQGFVPRPLLHVPRHIVRAVGPEPAGAPDAQRTFTSEIAEVKNLGKNAERPRRVVPVIHGRKLLSSKPRERRRLVPAHSADRVVLLSIGI